MIHGRAAPRAGAPGGTSAAQVLRGKPRRGGWERNRRILKGFGGWVGKDLKDQPVPARRSQQLPPALGGGRKKKRVVMESPAQFHHKSHISLPFCSSSLRGAGRARAMPPSSAAGRSAPVLGDSRWEAKMV